MIMPDLEPIGSWINRVGQNKPPPDLIEDILADTNEISNIVGRSEIGKTNFSIQLAHCLSTQTPFLNYNVLSKVPVAYIGFEVDKHEFRKRVIKIQQHIPASPNLWLDSPASFFKLDANTEDKFREAIKGFKVIIIDPVRYIVPGNYLDPKVITPFMQRLQQVMRDNNSLAIIVLYFKKLDTRSALEPGDLWNIKGGTEWGDMCSTVLMMEREKQGHKPTGGFAPVSKDNVSLYFAKTRNAANIHDPIRIHFNRDKCLFERMQT